MLHKVSRSLFTKRSLVSGFPSFKWIKGPAVSPQTDKYAIIAVIGHRLLWVRPRFLKGSVLEDFIQTCMMVGFVGLSTAMSEKLRCAPESYSLSEGMQISPACRKPKKHVVYQPSYSLSEGMQFSPACRKPKKHVVYAAHAMMLSKFSGFLFKKDFIWVRIEGVIRRRCFVCHTCLAWDALIAFITCARWGMSPMHGSENTWKICKWRHADRYDFIVVCASTSSAKCDT